MVPLEVIKTYISHRRGNYTILLLINTIEKTRDTLAPFTSHYVSCSLETFNYMVTIKNVLPINFLFYIIYWPDVPGHPLSISVYGVNSS